MKAILRIAPYLLCFIAFIPNASARIFTDIDGKTIDAELVSIDADEVTLRQNDDSKKYTLPLARFSVKDRNFIINERKAERLTNSGYHEAVPETIAEITRVTKDSKHFNKSQKIDALLADYWQTTGAQPAPIIDDSTYLRRAYLKIIGRIPTYAEAVHFLNDESTDKRTQLVDKLLDSRGYISHNFNLWADVLRTKTTGQQGSRHGGIYYVPWIKDQIRENVPYDQFVRTLLTADGYPWDNPAAAYYLRDFGMPLDNMSMTAQIFLGTQMQCAQCHDHPTDVWTQKDFYQLSAFTYGLKTGINVPNETPEIKELMQEIIKKERKKSKNKKLDYRAANPVSTARELFYPLRWKVEHTQRPLKLPHDYQYDDAKPNDVVEPKVIYGKVRKADLHDSVDRVENYAEWMVSQNNERFTTVIANRMWKQAMGKALIEPLDDLTAESVADSPELMSYLEALMIDLNYDLKQFQRVLYNTQYFQRQAVIDNPDLPDDYHMEGPLFQRMSAEQIWDSIATLMTPDIDNILQLSYTANDRGIRYQTGSKPGIVPYIDSWSDTKMKSYINSITDAYKEQQAARTAINELRNDPTKRNSPEFKAAQQRSKQANQEWNRKLNLADTGEALPQMGMTMMADIPPANPKAKRNKGEEKWIKGIRRASELSSPSNNGHLLEIFGQSDRLLIENSDNKGNVIQALFLMNSSQTNHLLANRSAPVMEARLAKTPADKLETLYIGFLARKPSEAEVDALLPYFEKEPEKARARIIWAMLNTQQFLFIQ